MESVADRAAAVRFLVLDVDGVLTDGRLYFTDRGEETKSFHVRDGAGIVQALRAGIQIGIISGRRSQAVERRATELGVTLLRQGIDDKCSALNEMLNDLKFRMEDVACVGDDSADVPIMRIARLAVAVADAHATAQACAHVTTRAAGGMGAVREVCDLLLEARRGRMHG